MHNVSRTLIEVPVSRWGWARRTNVHVGRHPATSISLPKSNFVNLTIKECSVRAIGHVICPRTYAKVLIV
jgi:hypothetical protein